MMTPHREPGARRQHQAWLVVPAAWLIIVVLSACGRAEPAPSTTAPTATAPTVDPVTIVAMGDSLTEGMGVPSAEAYPAQLERRLLDAGYLVEVINAGNSGETSSGARSRIDWVLSLEPDIVILATGGNDGLRGIDPGVTGENLDALVTGLQGAGATVIVAGMEMVQNMGEEYTTAFRALYPAVAAEHDAVLIPFLLDGVAANPDLNQPDFIHPTAEGYAVVVETVYPYVVDALETTVTTEN